MDSKADVSVKSQENTHARDVISIYLGPSCYAIVVALQAKPVSPCDQ